MNCGRIVLDPAGHCPLLRPWQHTGAPGAAAPVRGTSHATRSLLVARRLHARRSALECCTDSWPWPA